MAGDMYLSRLSRYTELDRLKICDSVYLSKNDYRELSLCPKLTYLDLSVSSLFNAGPLNCANLRVLKISGCGISDLSIVEGCYNLEELVLEVCFNLENINMLRKCLYLRKLIIFSCSMITDLSVLDDKFVNLEEVRIVNCRHLVKGFGNINERKGWIMQECFGLEHVIL